MMKFLTAICMLVIGAGEKSAAAEPLTRSPASNCSVETRATTAPTTAPSLTQNKSTMDDSDSTNQDVETSSEQLIDALHSRDALRVTDLVVQVREENAGKTVIPTLIRSLKATDPVVRWQAARALGMFGHDAESASDGLEMLVRDDDPLVCWAAAEALQKVRSNKDLPALALVRQLQCSDMRMRWDAAVALGLMGPNAEVAVPALIETLKDPNEWVRREAAHALGQIGPAAEPAVPALLTAMADRDEFVRNAASDSIETLVPRYEEMQSLISSFSLVTVPTADAMGSSSAPTSDAAPSEAPIEAAAGPETSLPMSVPMAR